MGNIIGREYCIEDKSAIMDTTKNGSHHRNALLRQNPIHAVGQQSTGSQTTIEYSFAILNWYGDCAVSIQSPIHVSGK